VIDEVWKERRAAKNRAAVPRVAPPVETAVAAS
jgi:hypothetical protein